MKGNTHDKNLEALNADIAKARDDIAALGVDLKKLAEGKIVESSIVEEVEHEAPANGDKRHGAWTDFRNRLDEAGARGEKVAKGIALEIERHPLIGGMAAFGLGFAIARLLFRRKKRDSSQ